MDLKTKAIKSTAWYVATRMWTQMLSAGATLILVRLLNPEDFGLFAVAAAVIAFLEFIQEFGLGTAIIQRQDLTRRQLNTVFWLLACVSLIITLLAFIGAGVAAGFYREPRLVWIIRILSLAFMLESLGVIPYSLLTREIDFRKRSLANALGSIVLALASVALAYLGYGVWSLVLGQLISTAVRNIAMFVFCRWMPGLDFHLAGTRDLLGFGVRVAGSSVISRTSRFVTTSIVARALGGYDLGLYTMAGSIGIRNPLHKFTTGVINQLSLPVFSKLQKDDEQLRTYYLKITKYLAVIALPLQVGMALVAHDMVLVLFSDKWSPISWLVQIYALGGVFSVLPLPSAPVLTARGRAGTVFKFSCFSAALTAIGYLVGVQWGLVGLATAWVIVFPFQRVVLLSLSLKEIGLSMQTYLRNIAVPLIATGAMTVSVILLGQAVHLHLGTFERLALDITVGALCYTIALLLMDRRFGTEMRGIAQAMFTASRA